ncbi:MAG: hypothetical protein CMJ64_01835 [Planctomycetaceae bacterium]|nr:hypothetical protein [Planctomycetaceae bacterium]
MRVDQLDDYDAIAISVNRLNGVYIWNDALPCFRSLKPTASAGYSILLFDLAQPGAREALRAAWDASPSRARRMPSEQDAE